MSPLRFWLSSTLSATFAVQPSLAGARGDVVEVVTFKLKAGMKRYQK